ncbi:MAG: hypothetical protein IJE91_02420 [Clostridia bacterium]|nr:hypothetical protein [Clostridia bacterium]
MQKQGIFTNDEYSVIINKNAKILSFNKLNNCTIYGAQISASHIFNSVVADGAEVNSSYLRGAIVRRHAKVGVFSHLREGSVIGEHVRIGNFVETKNSNIGAQSKVAHLTYVGDAMVGKNVNVGCGTVFCNYNGKIKQKTFVGDNVFIGSNSNLVAPLVIDSNTFIAAGSTITQNVPEHALAIARARQINKLNYLNT